MKLATKKNLGWYLLIIFAVMIFHIFGGFLRLMEKDFHKNFNYTHDIELRYMVDQMMEGKYHKPLNKFNYNTESFIAHICDTPSKLLFLVKSSPKNYGRRNLIRKTWGSTLHYKDAKTVFLVGKTTSKSVNMMLIRENEILKDLVLGSFMDTYYNLTLKTRMGLQWATEDCSRNVEFFMFVDDDYYVSTKNILKFLENPYAYPGTENNVNNISNFNPDEFCLYSGFVYRKARPIRKYFCKWFIAVKDYPYNQWPTFSTGGAYVLSRKSLRMLHYASLFSSFTKEIRFEDVFIGLLAYKLGIEPIGNNKNFKMEANYNFDEYRTVLAAHGFRKPRDLWMAWKEQSLADENTTLNS